MKRIEHFLLIVVVAVAFTVCEAPAANAQMVNAATPNAAAPTVDTLFALDRQADEAYFNSDGKFFEDFLSDK
ncbi:MAG: hypothetical protein ACREO5_15200, partial [Candidatus Binatia bacterium]